MNLLRADDSYKISSLKTALNCLLLQIVSGALRVKKDIVFCVCQAHVQFLEEIHMASFLHNDTGAIKTISCDLTLCLLLLYMYVDYIFR